LEVGCGTDNFTEIFAESGAGILAVDISRHLLEVARARNLPPRVGFVEGRFEDLCVEGPFDAVVGSSVLHHLDVAEALDRIHGMLKPGGLIAFAEPNMLNPQIFVERKFRKLFACVSPDETAFVRCALSRLLRGTGFENVRIIPFDWLHPALPPRLIPLALRVGRVLEKTPGLREFAGSLLISARKRMAPEPREHGSSPACSRLR